MFCLKLEKVYNSIDWRLLLLFAGLFIVVEGARPRVTIGFGEYLKVGVPLTLATILAGRFKLLINFFTVR